MKKSILITGVSGTGKSAIIPKLRELGYKAYDLETIPDMYTMYDQTTGQQVNDWDPDDIEFAKRMKWMCNISALSKLVSEERSQLSFYAGAGWNLNDMLPLFNQVVVLTADETTIRERLSMRSSNKFARPKEIQDMVIKWKKFFEDEWMKKIGATFITTDQTIGDVAKELIGKI